MGPSSDQLRDQHGQTNQNQNAGAPVQRQLPGAQAPGGRRGRAVSVLQPPLGPAGLPPEAALEQKGRGQQKQENKVVTAGDLKMDLEARRVFIGEKEINLTAKEFDVLELLAMNPNKVYSRENLLNLIWGYDYPGDARTVDVHIRRLREKIEMNPSEPKYVHTKWGVGYYFQG